MTVVCTNVELEALKTTSLNTKKPTFYLSCSLGDLEDLSDSFDSDVSSKLVNKRGVDLTMLNFLNEE